MTSTSSRALKLTAVVSALLTEQLAMACNTYPSISNLCNGERCINDIQCSSGNCFEPGDDSGYCMPVIPWWGILLIVLGSILFLVLLCLLICCCCRRRRSSRLSKKLETHHHYYDSNGAPYQQVPANANTGYQYPGQAPYGQAPPNQMR